MSGYKEIADYLLREIKADRYQPGAYLPSSNELARQFKVSRNTTVRALQEVILAGVAYTVPGAGTLVKEQSQKPAAAFPRSGGVPNIGILMGDLDDVKHQFMCRHISNIGVLAAQAGFGVRIFALAPSGVRDFLEERSFDGLLILGDFSCETVKMIHESGVPAVLVGNDWPGVPVSAVMAETSIGIDQALTLFHERGRKRVLILPGPAGHWIVSCFHATFRRKLALGWFDENECRFRACDWGEKAGYELGKALFAEGFRPDAVLAGEDYQACGVIRAAAEAGIRYPEEMPVIGCGNYPDLPGGMKLSSLDDQPMAMDQEAFRLLENEMRAGARPGIKHYLATKLIVREESL